MFGQVSVDGRLECAGDNDVNDGKQLLKASTKDNQLQEYGSLPCRFGMVENLQ